VHGHPGYQRSNVGSRRSLRLLEPAPRAAARRGWRRVAKEGLVRPDPSLGHDVLPTRMELAGACRLRRDQRKGWEIGAIAAHVAREQRPLPDSGVCADIEIRQYTASGAAAASISEKSLACEE
jgi:hypothetical protein